MMPKVDDEYLTKKQEYILACTGEVLREKPLYIVTMSDIIKKAGFSHGVIYRYYANLDEIFIDFINGNTGVDSLGQQIDALIESERSAPSVIADCIIALGEYVNSLFDSTWGRCFFELVVYYSHDVEKRTRVFPHLIFKQHLDQAKQKIVDYVITCSAEGNVALAIPVDSMVQFVNYCIDGITQNMAIMGVDRENQVPSVKSMSAFETLAQVVVNFIRTLERG